MPCPHLAGLVLSSSSTWAAAHIPGGQPTSRSVRFKVVRVGRMHVERRCTATSGSVQDPVQTPEEDEDFEGLTAEEDWEVPGTVNDSLSSNTQLGRAVQEACSELEGLQALEQDTLGKAEQLLRQLGYKGTLVQSPDSSPVEGTPHDMTSRRAQHH